MRLIVLYIVLAGLPFSVWAKNSSGLSDAGLTPESPLYSFDILDEQIRLFFTLNNASRLERRIASANERLAEAHFLAGKSVVAVKKALDLYQIALNGAEDQATRTGDENKISGVAELVVGHFEFLDQISERTPVEDRRFAQLAKEYTVDGHIKILKELVRYDIQAAFDLYIDTIRNRYQRILAVAIDKDSAPEALREYEKYIQASNALIEAARDKLIGSELPSLFIVRNIAAHGVVLETEVREKIRPQVEEQLKNAINALRVLQGLPKIELTPRDPGWESSQDPARQASPGDAGGPEDVPPEGSMPLLPQPLPTPMPQPKPIPAPRPKPDPKPIPEPTPPPSTGSTTGSSTGSADGIAPPPPPPPPCIRSERYCTP